MMKKILSVVMITVFLVTMMSVTAFAADFTPSVKSKPAPTIVPITDENGNEGAFIIVDENGVPLAMGSFDDIIVTPYAEWDTLPKDLKKMIENAYKQIQNSKTLDELTPELKLTAQDIKNGVKMENLVVRDLFDVRLVGDMADYLDGKNSITIIFDLGLDPDAFLRVMHNDEGSHWEVIPEDCIKRYKDGSVEVTFTSLSPVAFIVDKNQAGLAEPTGPSSPQTGEGLRPELLAALALGIAAVFCFTAARRKQG